MPRIPRLAETGDLTGSTLVKNAPGYVLALTVAWTGATAGALCYLRDGTNGSAPIEVAIVLDAAQGTYHFVWPQGKQFETAIYYDEGSTVNVHTEMSFL